MANDTNSNNIINSSEDTNDCFTAYYIKQTVVSVEILFIYRNGVSQALLQKN